MGKVPAGLRQITNRLGPEFWEFVRYGIASAGALAIDFGILVAAVELAGLHYLTGAVLGFTGGIVFIYAVSIAWVFGHRAVRNRRTEFMIFATIGIAGLLVNAAIMWTGTDLLGMAYQLSKLVSVVIVFLFNFTMRKALLFSIQRFAKEATL